MLAACTDTEVTPPEVTVDETIVQEIQQVIHPIAPNPLQVGDEELSSLDLVFDEARIVGLGEATHGTSQFFAMKDRIFRYLVEHYGYRVFAFEADFAESIYLNRYVLGAPGDLKEIMRDRMHFWTWRNDEVFTLLEWMRAYNESVEDDAKLHFIGVDCQYTSYQGVLLEAYLSPILPDLLKEFRPLIASTRNLSQDDYQALARSQFDGLQAELVLFGEAMETHRDFLVEETSLYEYEIHRQLIRTLAQTIEYFFTNYNSNDFNYRDYYMAENTLWADELLAGSGGTALWAHNYHVFFSNNSGSAGDHLRERAAYKVIGFSFNSGSFIAYDGFRVGPVMVHSPPPVNSINAVFQHTDEHSFILDLDSMDDSTELRRWFSQPRPFLSVGSTYNRSHASYFYQSWLPGEYDVIIHYESSLPAGYFN